MSKERKISVGTWNNKIQSEYLGKGMDGYNIFSTALHTIQSPTMIDQLELNSLQSEVNQSCLL